MMLKFEEIKSNEPKLTHREVCKQTGLFDSTIKRYRVDKHMDRIAFLIETTTERKQLNRNQLLQQKVHPSMKVVNLLQTKI